MTKEQFENWVGEYLQKRFVDSSHDSSIWRKDVLARYYRFGDSFDLPEKELYSQATFALWFTGGQKRG